MLYVNYVSIKLEENILKHQLGSKIYPKETSVVLSKTWLSRQSIQNTEKGVGWLWGQRVGMTHSQERGSEIWAVSLWLSLPWVREYANPKWKSFPGSFHPDWLGELPMVCLSSLDGSPAFLDGTKQGSSSASQNARSCTCFLPFILSFLLFSRGGQNEEGCEKKEVGRVNAAYRSYYPLPLVSFSSCLTWG